MSYPKLNLNEAIETGEENDDRDNLPREMGENMKILQMIKLLI